ncbi:MAG: carbamoyl-phosphate synthase large subunit [Clostridiaceae bacterium]|nr:carbamoyl-phosphate synthase large subunit [Clostridiaceae bacterium]
MPKFSRLKKVMVIGSGPIVIGQAAEFDYAGTQACRTLKSEGIEVVLVNSNPATIMTDTGMADRVYLEPLHTDVIRNILVREKVDGLLATLGGQTALNFAMELNESGFLAENNIQLLGTSAESIKRGEDRELFRAAMQEIGQPCLPSHIADSQKAAAAIAAEIGYPVIVRPAFTLGGTGGGIAANESELDEIVESGLDASRVNQVLIEQSIAGWKEVEYEVVRDAAGQSIVVCSMENFDPVGIHTGDSIVYAPAQTLSESDELMLREAALAIVEAIDIRGACNVQFALHPTDSRYAVIEINPRLSRSSALASKASGYPIAKVATRIALGYRLDEILNEITGTETALFPPILNYVVAKIPCWPFDKFVRARRTLGTQMKATGEVMSIGADRAHALLKAVRSLDGSGRGLLRDPFLHMDSDSLLKALERPDDRRLFILAVALLQGVTPEKLSELTGIDLTFLNDVDELVRLEGELIAAGKETEGETDSLINDELLRRAHERGYVARTIAQLTGRSWESIRCRMIESGLTVEYRAVDTRGGKSKAKAPYYYSAPARIGVAAKDKNSADGTGRKVVVLGSGPIRIGQGIEFDYCSVHAVQALREAGCETIIINNNPETVSTDYDTADKLYFEPLSIDDVLNILEFEQPDGVVCQFGGQTAIKLIAGVEAAGWPILGSSADSVDAAEDRERFEQILRECRVPFPNARTVFTTEQALTAARELGLPVLLRPSYVLGGQGMAICWNEDEVIDYMSIINMNVQEAPILVDKYLSGMELEVDAISDGKDILIPGIMEHLERAGIHSGDSISIFPAFIPDAVRERIVMVSRALAQRLNVIGLLNIQYILYNDELYCIEVNPRSSRTVPYISKITGLPIVDFAVQVMLGAGIADLGKGHGLYARYPAVYAIKAPVFSFEKLHDVDTQLGPEMKSTGEVLGLSNRYSEAMFKAVLASGFRFPKPGQGVLLTVRDADKSELLPLAERIAALGYKIYATGGTANYLNKTGVPASMVRRLEEEAPNLETLIRNRTIRLVVNTSDHSGSGDPGFRLRRLATEHGVPVITSLDTFTAVVDCLREQINPQELRLFEIKEFIEIVIATRQNHLPLSEMKKKTERANLLGPLSPKPEPKSERSAPPLPELVPVIHHSKLNEESVLLTLHAPRLAASAEAGQFLTLSSGEDRLLRRPMGICSLDLKRGNVQVGVRVQGAGTEWLAGLRPGQRVEVLGPLGHGFDLSDLDMAIIVGGGTGVFPLLELTRSCRERGIKTVTILGFKSHRQMVLRNEFGAVSDRLIIMTETGDTGTKGLVTLPLERILAELKPEGGVVNQPRAGKRIAVLVCGPTPMARACARLAAEYERPCQVSLEERMACGTGMCLGCAVRVKSSEHPDGYTYKRCCHDGPVFDSDEIIWE